MSDTKPADPVNTTNPPKRLCRAILVPDTDRDDSAAAPEKWTGEDLKPFLEGLFAKLREMRSGYAFVTIDGKDFNLSALQPRFLLKSGDETLLVEAPTAPIFSENGRFEFKLL